MSSYGKKINLANASAIQAVKQALEGLKEIRVLGKTFSTDLKIIQNKRKFTC